MKKTQSAGTISRTIMELKNTRFFSRFCSPPLCALWQMMWHFDGSTKTGGNVGWFAEKHHSSYKPERNWFKNQCFIWWKSAIWSGDHRFKSQIMLLLNQQSESERGYNWPWSFFFTIWDEITRFYTQFSIFKFGHKQSGNMNWLTFFLSSRLFSSLHICLVQQCIYTSTKYTSAYYTHSKPHTPIYSLFIIIQGFVLALN